MGNSMRDHLRQDMACEGLLECIHGLGDLEQRCFRTLVEQSRPMTVDDLAAAVDRERSTTYRAVQRLCQSGLVEKEQQSYETGGYCHVYRLADSEAIADDLQRTLNDWYAEMGQLVHEFRETYATEPSTSTADE
ncbi:Predicted transcriptional regulator [Halogranum amylolyticum]|uniref:Predicted transcriptional regulator n=1 Tax=Halogranum amylolyticum TaxID=660520 RepID=A0A1H8N326_9EURY|nr:helix-turn-helix domain-containing protein [Halogranum amylolyticum]SEO23919.1 Predicted transcriptional regulator [Halogranum amylolyticum]